MYCSNCRKKLNPENKFCPACGKRVQYVSPEDKVYTKVFKAENEKTEISIKEVREWLDSHSIELVNAFVNIYLNTTFGIVSVSLRKITFKYKKKKVDYRYGITAFDERNGVFKSAKDKCDVREDKYLKEHNAEKYKSFDREAFVPGGAKYRGRVVIYKKWNKE